MRKIKLASILCLSIILLAGCGKTQSDQQAVEQSVTEETTVTPAVETPMSEEAVGEESIGEEFIEEESTEEVSISEDGSTMTVRLLPSNINDYCEITLVEQKVVDASGKETGETEKIWMSTSKVYNEGWVLISSDCTISYVVGNAVYNVVKPYGRISQDEASEDMKPEVENVEGSLTFINKDNLEEYSISNHSRDVSYSGSGLSEFSDDIFADYPY